MLSNELKSILSAKNFGGLFVSGGGGEVFPDYVYSVTNASYTIPIGYSAKIYISSNQLFTAYSTFEPYCNINGKTCYLGGYLWENGRSGYALDFNAPLFSIKLNGGDVISLSNATLIAEIYLNE